MYWFLLFRELKKVVWAIESFEPYKSQEPDGIFAVQYRFLSFIVPWLVVILGSSLELGYATSKEWKDIKIAFIPTYLKINQHACQKERSVKRTLHYFYKNNKQEHSSSIYEICKWIIYH